MPISDFLGYLALFNPFSSDLKGKLLSGANRGISLLSKKEVNVLKPDQPKSMDQGIALSNFFAILGGVQSAIQQFVTLGVQAERKRAYRYFSEHYDFYNLKKAVNKEFQALRGNKNPMSAERKPSQGVSRLLAEMEMQATSKDVAAKDVAAFLSDETQLKALSLLRGSSLAFPLDEEIFDTIFHGKGSYHHEALPKVIAFVKSLSTLSLPKSALSALDEAVQRDADFRKLIADGKGKSAAVRKKELRNLATEMSQKVQGLACGESFVTIGGIRNGEVLESSLVDTIFSNFLPEELQALLKRDHSEKMIKQLTEKFKVAIWGEKKQIPGVGTKVEKAIRNALAKVNVAAESVLPEALLSGIKNSLKQDLDEILLGSPTEDGVERFGEKVWKELKEKGVEKVIQETLLNTLQNSRLIIESQLETMNEEVMAHLPATAKLILNTVGFPKGEEEAIWFQFERQKNGKFKLILFAEGSVAGVHPCGETDDKQGILLPLIYSDIDAKSLDEAFFYSLMSYRAIPEWDDNTQFTVQNLHKGLIASLNKAPDHPTNNTLVSREKLQGEGVWKYISLYLRYHLNLGSNEFEKIYSYNLRMQAFVSMWAHVQDDLDYFTKNPLIALQFEVAISELSDEGLELYKNDALSLSELKALFATIWEAEKRLNVEAEPVKTVSSVTIPPNFQAMAKELVLEIGVSPTQISFIKEVLIVAHGSDIEDVVDQALRDVLSTLTTDEMNEARAKRTSENLYTWEGIRKTAKNFRFSLFHFIRLYVNVSDLFSEGFASQLLESLILMYFPAIGGYTSMSVGALSKLLVYFGPSVLKPIVPDPIYQSICSVYRLVKEVQSYVKRRLYFTIVRVVTSLLVDDEAVSRLSAQAKSWNQKMTRSGELSYLIPHGKNNLGHLRLKPLEQLIIPPSTVDTAVEKPKIGKKISRYDSTSDLPRPYLIKLTKDNLHQELAQWALEARVICNNRGLGRVRESRNRQGLLYLNRQIRNLELPRQTTMWNEVDPIETMKLLQKVVYSMGDIQDFSSDEHSEVIVSVYTIYALMDHLARRNVEAQLPSELGANGCDFGIWLQSPATRVSNPRTYLQLVETANYFGFDLQKTYTEDEIDRRRPHCLFNYKGKGERFYTGAFIATPLFDPYYESKISCWGLKSSKDGGYYRQLLKDPGVQRRLKACGVKPEANEWEQFKVLFSNQRGPEGAPLPNAFAMLRSMDQCARKCVIKDVLSFRPMAPPLKKNGGDYGSPVFKRIVNCFHTCTGNLLRDQSFFLSHSEIRSGRFSENHRREISRRIYDRGTEHFGNERESFQATRKRESREALLLRMKERSVDEIMAQSPLDIKNLSLHEKRLLEMINSDKEDQVMQTLGYFNRMIGHLREPRFRILFDLFINRLGALQCQAKYRSDLPQAIGTFFKDALEQFDRQGDIETCLYLTKIGQELERFIGLNPENTFPDFRAYLRDRLIPNLRNLPSEKRTWKFGRKKQDLIVISYYHLILTYGSMNPETAVEEERKKAIEDIARLVYTLLPTTTDVSSIDKPDVMIKAEEVLFLWEPYLKEALQGDPALCKEVIESILRDVGMGSMVGKENRWEGTYPVFTNGKITLDLMQKTQTVHEISVEVAKERAARIVPEPGNGIRLTERSFSFPDKKMIVEFPKGTYRSEAPCVLYRQFAGVNYEYLPVERRELLQAGKRYALPKEEILWLERPPFGRTRHLLCMKGEDKVWRHPVRPTIDEKGNPLFEVCWNHVVINGTPVHEVSLANELHGLALLSWFEDESGIKAYAHACSPEQLAFIEFPKKGLRFEVRKHGDDLQAMALGDATGYYLAKEQKNEHLLKYGKYLLMENTRGKKKVYVALKDLMVDFIIGNLGRIETSPLIERYISTLTPDVASESQLLLFDMDSDGNLATSDPMGLAYLALFNFIKGDREASMHFFSQVEVYGRKHPFPKKIYSIFELMYLPLLCTQDRFSREIALRLGAIQTENQLIQHSEETGETTLPTRVSRTTKWLQWVLLQVKYAEYLQEVKEGLPAALNDFQELFLLTGMSNLNRSFYLSYAGGDFPKMIKKSGKRVGLEDLANSFLFPPDVMERYHELRLQLDKESQMTSKSRGAILQAIQFVLGQNDGNTDRKIGQMKGGLSQMIELVDRAKNSAFFNSLLSADDIKLFHRDVEVYPELATVPTALWELDGEALRRNFPLYYRLAKNERPSRTDQALFERKRSELLRSLALMQGNYSSDETLQREILLAVSTDSGRFAFVSASELENAIVRRQKIRKRSFSQNTKWFFERSFSQNTKWFFERSFSQNTKWFDTFILDNLIMPCHKTQIFNKDLETSLRNKVWNIVKGGADKILYFAPGWLLPFPLRVLRCGKEVVSLANTVRKGDPDVVYQGARAGAQLGDVVVKTLFPEYERFAWGLSWLPWLSKGWTLCRVLKHESLRETSPSAAVTSRGRSKLRTECLEATIADQLKQRDGAINRAFDELFDEFFIGEVKFLPINNRNRVKDYDTCFDEEALNSAFEEINKSLRDYYDRKPERHLKVRLKQGKDPQEFTKRAHELTQFIGKYLQEEEEKIIELVRRRKKQRQEDQGMQIVQKLSHRKFGEEALTFQQIYILFTHCDDEAFLKRIELDPDQWGDLKARLYLYQTVRRRFNLLFNQMDKLRKGEVYHVEDTALELKRRPAYDLGQNVPELVLRAKLSYEVAMEFMLYKTANQSTQLDRLLTTDLKKVVSEQIMGTGKTFLMPTADRVYADGRSLLFNVVIDPVAPSNFDLFIRNTKKAFGQVGSIFRFNRSMIWTRKQLWAFGQVLQRAFYLGEHMNARQKDLQGLELRFLEEALDVTGAFEEKDSSTWKQRLQHYKDSLSLMRKKGIENSDEKHRIDDPTSGILNFPLEKHLVLQSKEIQIMNEIMLLLLTIPDFRKYITIKAKRP